MQRRVLHLQGSVLDGQGFVTNASGHRTCPTCGEPLPPPAAPPSHSLGERWPSFPFCSRRCKLVDLGRWFDGEYVIRGRKVTEEEIRGRLSRAPRSNERRRH